MRAERFMALLDRLYSTRGTIDRVSYAIIGFAAFGLKFNIDRWLIAPRFGYQWSIFDYWSPTGVATNLTALGRQDYAFLLTLVAASLPFLWVGIATTIKRLRDAYARVDRRALLHPRRKHRSLRPAVRAAGVS